MAEGESWVERYEALRDGSARPGSYAVAAGIEVVEAEPGRVVVEAVPTEAHRNLLGTVHGGWVATVLDSALGTAAHTRLPAASHALTIEIKVNMLRPPVLGVRLRAEAVVLHAGRRTVVCEAKLRDPDDRLVAIGTATFAVAG
jgi:uncharacterized protein (TIGR00369 family)